MAEGTPIGALAVRIGADASDLVKELGRADTAIDKTSKQFQVARAAAVGFAGVAAGVGVAVAGMVKHVVNTADELGKLSQKVGVSVESLSALKFAAKLSDVSLDQLATGLKHLSKFMVENNIQGVSTEEQLLRIADDFAKAADGAGKTAVAMKYFGKSGADLIPLLNMGRAGIEELRKEAERMGIIISTQAAKDAETFNDNLTRLKGSVEGLTIQLSGTFVKALGDATQAMIDAQKRGAGPMQSLLEAWRTYVTGTDADKWTREMHQATAKLTTATKEYGAALKGAESPNARLQPEEAAKSVEKYRLRLVAAQEEVNRLLKIGPVMVPEMDKPKADNKPQLKVPGAPDEKALKDARDAYLKAFEMEQEAVRLGQEFTVNERAKELEETQKHNQMLIELERQRVEEEVRLEAELGQIMDDFRRKERENEDRQQKERMGQTKTFLGSLSGLMNTNSKKMFEIGKKAAIAETLINTYTAAMGAYKALASIPIVGPALGAAAAAAVTATGLAQVQNIRAAQFGGGGGAAGVFPANPVTGEPRGTPGGEVGGGRSQTTIIKGINPNDLFTGRQLRNLLDGLTETMADGGRIVIA